MTALIFDLDDTLLVQEKTNRDLLAQMGKEIGLNPLSFVDSFLNEMALSYGTLKSLGWCRQIGISAGELLWGDFSLPQPTLQSQTDLHHWEILSQEVPLFRSRVWNRALGREFSPSRVQELAETFLLRRKELLVLLPGAAEVLTELSAQYTLAILTNGAPGLQWYKIQACGLAHLFQVKIVSGDWGIGKPHPRIFEITLKALESHLGQKPAKTFMIGNSLSSDIRGADHAGLPSLWLDWENATPPQDLNPTAIVKTLGEIPAALSGLFN